MTAGNDMSSTRSTPATPRIEKITTAPGSVTRSLAAPAIALPIVPERPGTSTPATPSKHRNASVVPSSVSCQSRGLPFACTRS